MRFVFERVLSQNARAKTFNILGRLQEVKDYTEALNEGGEPMVSIQELGGSPAILLLEKSPLREPDVQCAFGNFDLDDKHVIKKQENDIYSTLTINATVAPHIEGLHGISATLICPCSKQHIIKYSSASLYMVTETPTMYRMLVEPHFQKRQLSLDWVTNLLQLEEKGELPKGEEFYFNDRDGEQGFAVIRDYKWDGKDLETFHFIAFARNPRLKSIRDLCREDCPLIERMLESTYEVIKRTLGISRSRVKAYFHYPPSFYRLHIHFTNANQSDDMTGVCRAHLAQNVIENLKDGDGLYYNRRNLYYTITNLHPEFEKMVDLE